MEDIRVMRETKPSSYFVSVPTTGRLIVPYNASRVSLTITGPVSEIVTLSWESMPVSLEGVTINNGTVANPLAMGPLKFTMQEDGAIVKGPIWAITAVATGIVGIVESCLEKQ